MSSSLKSFSFGVYQGFGMIPKEVWALFTEMSKNPDKPNPYVYEIFQAALQGRIQTDEYFFIDAYCRAIESNTKLADFSSRKKLLRCVDDSEIGQDSIAGSAGYGTIPIGRVSMMHKMEDTFERVLDSEELMYSISKIKSLQPDFIINEGVDVVEVLRNAVRGIPSAIEKLKYLCSSFKDLAEYVQVVLSSGLDISECFAY